VLRERLTPRHSGRPWRSRAVAGRRFSPSPTAGRRGSRWVLAGSFGTYGLLKNRVGGQVGALAGLATETLLARPGRAARPWPGWSETGRGTFGENPPWQACCWLRVGVITVLPLGLFAASARRVPLTTLGLLQYITPVLQLLCGVPAARRAHAARPLDRLLLVWLRAREAHRDSLRTSRQRPPQQPNPSDTELAHWKPDCSLNAGRARRVAAAVSARFGEHKQLSVSKGGQRGRSAEASAKARRAWVAATSAAAPAPGTAVASPAHRLGAVLLGRGVGPQGRHRPRQGRVGRQVAVQQGDDLLRPRRSPAAGGLAERARHRQRRHALAQVGAGGLAQLHAVGGEVE
jgi:hypothetical protein